MKVGDIVKFKNGRSHYQHKGYEYSRGTTEFRIFTHKSIPVVLPRDYPINDNVEGDRENLDKPFPKKMRGKLAIITKMDSNPNRVAATEVCMITHDPYGNGDKIVPLPDPPPIRGAANFGSGFIEGLDLEVISSGKR